MSNNIADLIEDYILRRLAAEQEGHVELSRNDIADAISCAPSQISYVLNTRFTHEKGFLVESRRGIGGYIRIAQKPMRNLVYQDMLEKLEYDLNEDVVISMVNYLLQHQMITKREAAMMIQMISIFYSSLSPIERVRSIRSLFMVLEQFS